MAKVFARLLPGTAGTADSVLLELTIPPGRGRKTGDRRVVGSMAAFGGVLQV